MTVSYLAEEALLESTASRRAQLQASKSFRCDCSTCTAPADAARGLACPACREGVLLPLVAVEAGSPPAFRPCSCCGFLPTAEQAAELAAQEAEVEQRVQLWERKASRVGPEAYLTDEVAGRIEASLAELLSPHHWLQDKARRQLIAYYEATGRLDLALRLAEAVVQHVAVAWPGFTAMRAWALELEGDLELRLARFQVVGGSEVTAPLDMEKPEVDHFLTKVAMLYSEAYEMLRVLFGEAHEFSASMHGKCTSVNRILTEHFTY